MIRWRSPARLCCVGGVTVLSATVICEHNSQTLPVKMRVRKRDKGVRCGTGLCVWVCVRERINKVYSFVILRFFCDFRQMTSKGEEEDEQQPVMHEMREDIEQSYFHGDLRRATYTSVSFPNDF